MNRSVRVLLAVMTVGGVMALTVAPASAAPFTNGGFETPDIDPNAFVNYPVGSAAITGWTVVKGNVDLLNSPTFTVSEGTQAAHISGISPVMGTPNAGGVAQVLDDIAGTAPIGGKQYTLQYDWTSKCAGSNVRVSVDSSVIDSATNAAATYPTYSTRIVNFQPVANTTTLQFDTTTPGASGTSICGTIIDNVRLTAATTNPTPAASPASRCAGATGHRVQFRKSNGSVAAGTAGFSDAKDLYNRPVTDPLVASQDTHNGVPYINYQDSGAPSAFPARPSFDVANPPLVHVGGTGSFLAGADDDWATRSTGYINIPVAGVWTFSTNSDDGVRLVMGNPGVLIHSVTIGTASTPVSIPAPGCYHYALEWFNGPSFGDAAFYASGPGQVGVQPVGDVAANGTLGTSTLQVYQGTDIPSSCKITAVRRAPNTTDGIHDEMDVTISDADGLGGIYNIQYTNLTISVIPAGWLPGLNGPVIVRATKVNNAQPAAWSFTMSDFNGVEKVCS